MQETSVNSLLNQKKSTKSALAKDLHFSKKAPLLAIILDKDLSKQYKELVTAFLKGAPALNMEVVILADKALNISKNFEVKNLPYNRQNRKVLLEAADMSLAFPFNDVEEMLINGVIPVSLKRGEVQNYNPNEETGNSFIYEQSDPWHLFAALVRARETFKFPYDWKHIVREGVGSVMKVGK